MKRKQAHQSMNLMRSERGAVAIVAALSIVALVGVAAFTIDLGRAFMARDELQNAADSAALAATRQVGEYFKDASASNQLSYSLSSLQIDNVQKVAKNVSLLNYADKKSLNLAVSDIEIGNWKNSAKKFTAINNSTTNAVRVTTRLNDALNGPLSTIFGRVFRVSNINLFASATAACTGLSQSSTGELNAPFGLSQRWWDTHSCGSPVSFSPTDSCASWHAFQMTGTSATDLTNVITILATGSCPVGKNGKIVNGCTESSVTAETYAMQTSFNFNGGAVQAVMPDLQNLYDLKKDSLGKWFISIPIYQEPAAAGCGNPNGFLKIVGYAKVEVQSVNAKTGTIYGIVRCDLKTLGPGGGNDYGLLSSTPKIVE